MAFGYYKPVVIDNTKVSGTGDLSNFPVLVSKTDANLKTVANGGHVTSSSGYDIYFYSNSGLTTKLDHELIFYAPTTGQIIAWVRIPTLDGDADTTIYMAYGDSGITTNPSATGTWDSTKYIGVYHLDDDPTGGSGSIKNSVADSLHGTPSYTTNAWESGDLVTGKIYKALSYNNTTDKRYILVSNLMAQLDAIDTWTISQWFTVTATNQNAYVTSTGGVMYILHNSDNKIYVRGDNGSSLYYAVSSAGLVSQNTWYLLTGTKNGSDGTDYAAYINGSAISLTHNGTANSNDQMDTKPHGYFGRYGTEDLYSGGLQEEVRVMKVASTPDWIATEYANQNDPATFLSLGTEVEVGGGEPPATAIKDLIGGFIPYPR